MYTQHRHTRARAHLFANKFVFNNIMSYDVHIHNCGQCVEFFITKEKKTDDDRNVYNIQVYICIRLCYHLT